MSHDWSVEIRAATAADIAKAGANASIGEAAAWLLNGELVAVTDEYGTATLVAGTNSTPTEDDIEKAVEPLCDLLAAASATRNSP